MTSITRRDLLRSSALAGLAAMLGRPISAWADSHGSQSKNLILMWANGGWDPTFVFEVKPGLPGVVMPEGEVSMVGNLPIWSSSQRPAVNNFFDAWGSMTNVINGINVPSVAHPGCRIRMLTGYREQGHPDVGAVAGHALSADLPMPYLVMGDANFVGSLGASVGRVGRSNQLKALLDGAEAYPIAPGQFDAALPPDTAEAALIRQYLLDGAERQRQLRGAHGYNKARIDDFVSSLARSDQLVDKRDLLESGKKQLTFAEQIEVTADALQHGLSRTAMIDGRLNWDTHADNDKQGGFYNELFLALDDLTHALAVRPGSTAGHSLLDETVIVAMSEMGRTPLMNSAKGKDHWPVTSALVIGAGVKGEAASGATDDLMLAVDIDMNTGAPSEQGEALYPENLLAGLLELVGVDPATHFPGIHPLRAFHG